MENEKKMKLEGLEPEKQEWLLELASRVSRLMDLVEPLRKEGIEVSLSTLTRFVRKHRQEQLLAAGEELRGTAETLVKRNDGETFRKGTIEAVRQRLYEQALNGTDAEAARKLYGDLLREEEKLKELELAERKMALEEEQVRLKRVRLEMEARGRNSVVQAEVVEAKELRNADCGLRIGEGRMEGATEDGEVLKVLVELEGVLNRGGDLEGKVGEARGILADWRHGQVLRGRDGEKNGTNGS